MAKKRTFYHGTDVPDKILKSGFKNAEVSLWGPGVYLSGDSTSTKRHGSSTLQVDVKSSDIVDLGEFPKDKTLFAGGVTSSQLNDLSDITDNIYVTNSKPLYHYGVQASEHILKNMLK